MSPRASASETEKSPSLELWRQLYTAMISICELAERVRARTGSSSEIVTIPYDQAYEAGFEDMRRRVPDVGKIKQTIGWEPTTLLDETIDQIITYQKGRLKNRK